MCLDNFNVRGLYTKKYIYNFYYYIFYIFTFKNVSNLIYKFHTFKKKVSKNDKQGIIFDNNKGIIIIIIGDNI